LLQTFQNPSLYKSIENPFFSSLCGANQTRSAALARYPLAIPFRPQTVEKQYKYQGIRQWSF